MEPEALILIEGEVEAMRLVASWPNLSRYDVSDEELRLAWSEISGVDVEDIERWEPILIRNGILGPEGFVHEQAVAFIRSKVAAKMPKVTKEVP